MSQDRHEGTRTKAFPVRKVWYLPFMLGLAPAIALWAIILMVIAAIWRLP